MTPLVLIVGFLGAGKTTVLRYLAPALKEHGLRPHVILNDYQNARLDASLLNGLAESIAPITGDCVCCSSLGELIETLDTMQLSPNSVVLLEANGTTDAIKLIEYLSLEPRIARYTMPVQLSVVDPKRWQKRKWNDKLEREQVVSASHFYLSHADDTGGGRLRAVAREVGTYAPNARRVELDAFAHELKKVVEENAHRSPRRLTMAGAKDDHDHDHHHDDDHDHRHTHHFASFECALPSVVSESAFKDFFEKLPEEVLRAKGMVRFIDAPGTDFIFQYTGDVEDSLIAPLDQTVSFQPMAIFIGGGLPEDEIRAKISGLGPVWGKAVAGGEEDA